ncbi:hypothetical protein IFR05_008844 [Cadophora sp. M221]|nr:hypothetical protein IFR05_008844 [Cadophora sp. M221]
MPVTFPNRPPGGWMSVPKEELPKGGGWLNTRVSLTERWNAMYMQEDPNVGGPLHAFHQYAASVRPVEAADNQEYVSPAPPAYNYNNQEHAASAQPIPSAQSIYSTQEYTASTHEVDAYTKQEYVASDRPAYKRYATPAHSVDAYKKQEYASSAQPTYNTQEHVASARPVYKQEYVASTHQVDAYNNQDHVESAQPVYNTQEHVASARPVYQQGYAASAHPVDAYNKQEYVLSTQPTYNTQERVASARPLKTYSNAEYLAAYDNQGYKGYVAPVHRHKTRLLKEHPPFIKKWLADAAPSLSPSILSSISTAPVLAEEQHVEEQHVQEQQHAEEQRVEEQHVQEHQFAEEQFAEEKRVAEERVSQKRVEERVEEQQYVGEERDDTEVSGWDINEEFTESNLTTSPRLKIRHIKNDGQRDILRQLSRVLSQSPAPKPVATKEIELPALPESPENETTLEKTEIENPAPIHEPTAVPTSVPITPAVIIPTSHAKDMTLEDSTLDAFETALEDPISIPTTFEQYFAMEVAERERLIDEAVRARMNNRLDHTKNGIRDARKGIGRLDDFISSIPSAPIMPAAPTITEAPKAVAVVTATTNLTEKFGANNSVLELKIKIRRPEWCQFWTMNPEPQTRGRFASFGTSRNWKFTWLGLILAIFSAWYLTESVMCGIYCHPTTSSTNTWQPSDPFFPYAIPTKLDQWTGKVVSSTAHATKIHVANFLDPEGARFEIHPRNAYMGARDWWQGRSGPVGYRACRNMDIGIESDEETF